MNEKRDNINFPDGRPSAEQPKWRHDFPIDVENDEYAARRDFNKFLILTSFAFVVGQFWIAVKTLFRRGVELKRQRLIGVNEMEVGQAIPFHYPTENDPCILIRTGEAEFLAYDSRCTHLMCALQPEVEEGRLHCPCHRGYFDLTSGRPTAGPPRRPLPLVKLETKKGVVYATGVEYRT